MYKHLLSILTLILTLQSCTKQQPKEDFITTFEKSNGTETASYTEVISFYKNLAKTYGQITITERGFSDSGEPMHMVTLNPDKNFDYAKIKENKRVMLINNGIHPGESDGIDATMMLFRDIVQGKINSPKSTVLVTIPIYNIGGSLNRNSTTRTNQNGPLSYGFRGNGRNYDLNRDFIKSDTKNTSAFATIFHEIQPDIFIDNHVSNGADYQYTLTHLFTQHNKLGGQLGTFLHTKIMPELELKLLEKKWDITPYVNVFNSTPEKGFAQFMDSPRYSTGYTTLFNTIGLMVETHMLKPYKQRVEGTYELMRSMIEITEENGKNISQVRRNAFNELQSQTSYPLQWIVDTSKTSTLQFKGYDGQMIDSKITGLKRLKYDRTKPFTKEVIYNNYMKPSLKVDIPEAYVIPKAWSNITNLMTANGIIIQTIKRDTTLAVTSYKIKNYTTKKQVYEGHYPHSKVAIESHRDSIHFHKGDFLIKTNQYGLRYILETLEPQAPDSFFNWNFFDTILQQKEGFSPYVWEDKAAQILAGDPRLRLDFVTKKNNDSTFANNWYAQLDWLHKRSDHYEKAHLQYPVYRVER